MARAHYAKLFAFVGDFSRVLLTYLPDRRAGGPDLGHAHAGGRRGLRRVRADLRQHDGDYVAGPARAIADGARRLLEPRRRAAAGADDGADEDAHGRSRAAAARETTARASVSTSRISDSFDLLYAHRFTRVSRRKPAHNWPHCRGTELAADRGLIEGHLLVLGTFDDLAEAKVTLLRTVSTIFGSVAWDERRRAEIVELFRLYSLGGIALGPLVDKVLEARGGLGAFDPGGPLENIGEALFRAGLVAVEDGVLVEGPRLVKARRALMEKRGYGPNSFAVSSLTVESTLVVWFNLVLSDLELQKAVPRLASASAYILRTFFAVSTVLHSSTFSHYNSCSVHADVRPLFLGSVLDGRRAEVPGPAGQLLEGWRRRCLHAAGFGRARLQAHGQGLRRRLPLRDRSCRAVPKSNKGRLR